MFDAFMPVFCVLTMEILECVIPCVTNEGVRVRRAAHESYSMRTGGRSDFTNKVSTYIILYIKGKGKVIPIIGPVWPRGWVEV